MDCGNDYYNLNVMVLNLKIHFLHVLCWIYANQFDVIVQNDLCVLMKMPLKFYLCVKYARQESLLNRTKDDLANFFLI